MYLVFKVHPLERGHSNAKSLIKRVASQAGVGERVFLIDDGSIGQVTKFAKAMITINSTSALSALHFGVPLAVLGDAMFRREDLAACIQDEQDIDNFWSGIKEANKNNNENFMRNIRCRAIIPGDFYSKKNRALTCRGVVEKSKNVLTGLSSTVTLLEGQELK